MRLTIGYFFDGSSFVGVYIRPYRSVWPSRAFTVIGVGGFQPVASSFEMSAFSSSAISLPVVASRSTATGGASGFE